VSDQFGDCARPAFRLRGLLVGVNAQCVSCFEGRCFSGESGNRADDGFALFACPIWAGLRHLSRPPCVVSRTRSTSGVLLGFSSRALSIASLCVGRTSLALSESGLLTA
jgi:hypothetical protein